MTDRPVATSLARPAPRRLLTRLLDEPQLVEALRRLDGAALGRLVSHVGLEDAGELLALCTTAQLGQLLDEDVWRSARPGQDERFDAARFTVWLEVLLELGDAEAAKRLAELPEELVTAALSQLVMVVDLDELAAELSGAGEDADPLEKALDGTLQIEIDQYRVMARPQMRDDGGWDALASALLALDRDHGPLLERLLARLCAATSSEAEDSGGLERLLSLAEQLEEDAAAEREDRRAREGYVSPSQAAAFLQLARTTALTAIRAQRERDPITRAYFREYAPAARSTPSAGAGTSAEGRVADRRLDELLRDAQVFEEPRSTAPIGLLGDGGGAARPDETRLRDALARLGERDEAAHGRRLDELGFLANVLLAGCTLDGERLRPLDAAEIATALCNLGLDHELAEAERAEAGRDRDPVLRAANLLASTGADKLLRIGLRLLHENVALPAGRALQAQLTALSTTSAGRDPRLSRARTVLEAGLRDDKPFGARRRILDLANPPALPGSDAARAALPLLDEIPRLPAAAPATARLIATRAALDEARAAAAAIGKPAGPAHNAPP